MAIIQLCDVDLAACVRDPMYAVPTKNHRSIRARVAGLLVGLPGSGWRYYRVEEIARDVSVLNGHCVWHPASWHSNSAPYATGPSQYYEAQASRPVFVELDPRWLEGYGRERFEAQLPAHLCLRDVSCYNDVRMNRRTIIDWKQTWLENVFVGRLLKAAQTGGWPNWKHYGNVWLGACEVYYGVPSGAPVVTFDAEDDYDMLVGFPRVDRAQFRLNRFRVGYPRRKLTTKSDYLSLADFTPHQSFRSYSPTIGDFLREFEQSVQTYTPNVVHSNTWKTARMTSFRTFLKARSSKDRAPARQQAPVAGRRVRLAEDQPVYGFSRNENDWIVFALDERLEGFNYVPVSENEVWPRLSPTRVRIMTGQCNSLHLHYSEADQLWRGIVTRGYNLNIDMTRSARIGLSKAITVSNSECTRRPLYFTPPRGMPKHVATAIRETPYMASAIQHILLEAQGTFHKGVFDLLHAGESLAFDKDVIAHTFPAACGRIEPNCRRRVAHHADMRVLLSDAKPVSANTIPAVGTVMVGVQPVAETISRTVEAGLDLDYVELCSPVIDGRSRRRLEL